MGKHDNRRSMKMRRRKRQVKKKARLKRRKVAAKGAAKPAPAGKATKKRPSAGA